MTTLTSNDPKATSEAGQVMYEMIRELLPLPRSITGEGIRQTLRAVAREIPLEIRAVPSGRHVFDWTVPREWVVRDAYIADASGRHVVDIRDSFLHLMGYSTPVHATMSLDELRPHLHTIPNRPDWIPFRASFYSPNWGFCVSQRTLESMLDEERYTVVIDSELVDGVLNYGECFLPGQTEKEVLISTHACHPAMANDCLSGVALATQLARDIQQQEHRLSYRFVFIPASIGSLVWLAENEHRVDRISHGLVVTCVGDAGPVTYKKSRRGNAEIDQAAQHVLRASGRPFRILEFEPYGYDERNYCSLGFNLPVGSLSRSRNGQYVEYHSSADDLNLVRPTHLGESLACYRQVVRIIEGNAAYVNLYPKGEVQLGKRGLFSLTSGLRRGPHEFQMAMLWILNMSDGWTSLLDIADRASMPFDLIREAADALLEAAVIRPASHGSQGAVEKHRDE